MTGYRQHERDGLAGALALQLLAYCVVGGCGALGLYELLQPTRSTNPGLAAYKPPPATVIRFGASPSYPIPAEPVVAGAPLLTSEPETTGRSIPTFEQKAPDTATRPRREARKPNQTKPVHREVKSEPSTARVACIARYDSSGAQTGGC